MHDNDSITGFLTMNVIPLASNWVRTSNLPNLGLQLQILISSGATAAQWVSVMQSAVALLPPTLAGFAACNICALSTSAGGAMAMLCDGINSDGIRLVGLLHLDEMY
jgi:hypothetical protein